MDGHAKIIGSIPAYAGGAILAKFVRQGGGSPMTRTEGATIGQDGTFSLDAWDNGHAKYAPSMTTFLIQAAPGKNTTWSATVSVVPPNDKPVDLTNVFVNAPKPMSGVQQ